MPSSRDLKLLAALSALPLALLSTSCGDKDRPVLANGSRPAEALVAPVARPTIPPATTPCADDPARLCNSDAEAAGVLAGFAKALDQANRKLCWLTVWFGYPACAAGPR